MKLLLLSNAKREGMGYLEHAAGHLRAFLANSVTEVLFVPYAGVSKTHDQFVDQVRPVLADLGIGVKGIHTIDDAQGAIRSAQAIVVGGGSTWVLLREMRERRLLRAIRQRVQEGAPYVGWSAGANVACPTIMTTNDMPICDPGGFDALGLVPFQINPHYLHGNPPGFKGETREERITEFGILHPDVWVVGLREGAGLRVDGGSIALLGDAQARVFRGKDAPRELDPGADCSFLLRPA